MDLSHLHLKVTDVSASRKFYETIFGFREDFVCDQDEVFLKNDEDFVIGLQKLDEAGTLPGWFHFGFGCKSEGEVVATLEKLKSSNGKLLRELQDRGGAIYFFCADPDGNKIEVYFNKP